LPDHWKKGENMSWQTINKVLGLAMVDGAFAQRLLKEPREALDAYGIRLAADELEILCTCKVQTLHELGEQLVARLGPETPTP
jgi:hypothetical protein